MTDKSAMLTLQQLLGRNDTPLNMGQTANACTCCRCNKSRLGLCTRYALFALGVLSALASLAALVCLGTEGMSAFNLATLSLSASAMSYSTVVDMACLSCLVRNLSFENDWLKVQLVQLSLKS